MNLSSFSKDEGEGVFSECLICTGTGIPTGMNPSRRSRIPSDKKYDDGQMKIDARNLVLQLKHAKSA